MPRFALPASRSENDEYRAYEKFEMSGNPQNYMKGKVPVIYGGNNLLKEYVLTWLERRRDRDEKNDMTHA